MRSRFLIFGLCCLAAVSYTAFGQRAEVNSESSISERIQTDQIKPTNTEKSSYDVTTKQSKNREGQESTQTEKGIFEKGTHQESKQPFIDSEIKQNEGSSKDRNMEKQSSKDSDKENSKNDNEETDKINEEDDENGQKEVCFENLGCFETGKPWKSILRPIAAPDSPEKIQTTILFFSRQNLENPVYIPLYPEIRMGGAKFDPSKKSVMIIHGFGGAGNSSWLLEMKDAYLKEVDANVMLVDWGPGAQHSNYLQVAGNTRVVGRELALFVKYLRENYGADPKNFHIIGHSLGAQISSYLGKEVRGIGRITALDPAQPGFEGFEKEVRLDETDANFVDVIHTDAKPFVPTLGFGMIAPHGHVDFYLNGGYSQPGCAIPKNFPSISGLSDLSKFTAEALDALVNCSHGRAHQYFTESLDQADQCVFWGHKADPKNVFKSVTNTLTQGLLKEITALSPSCSEDDCIPMGLDTEKSPLRGIFVVTTNKKKPFCISENSEKSKTFKLLSTVKQKLKRN